MTAETVMTMTYQAMKVALAMAGPLLIITLIVGLVISIFQAATQINEQMLSFLPRLLITLGMLVFAGHWILRTLSELFIQSFHQAGHLVG